MPDDKKYPFLSAEETVVAENLQEILSISSEVVIITKKSRDPFCLPAQIFLKNGEQQKLNLINLVKTIIQGEDITKINGIPVKMLWDISALKKYLSRDLPIACP